MTVCMNCLYDFYKETNIPLLCNTSLNHTGEPVVEIIEQAFQFALNNSILILYISGWRYQIAVGQHNRNECILDREMKSYLENLKKEDISFNQGNPYDVTKIVYIFIRVYPRYRISSLYSKEEIIQMRRAYPIA